MPENSLSFGLISCNGFEVAVTISLKKAFPCFLTRIMRTHLLISILLVSSWGVAQNCVTYLLATPINPDTAGIISGLRAEDFEASLDNSLLPVVKATESYHTRTLVLAEATNKGVDQMTAAILNGALGAFTEQPIALGVFAERAVFTREFSTNPEERKAGADQLISQIPSIGKRTAVYEALHQALQVFGKHQTGDTIILLASEPDNGSHRKLGDIEEEFVHSGTRLFALSWLFAYPIPLVFANGTMGSHGAGLTDFAAMTGGTYSSNDLFRNRKHTVNFAQLASTGYLLEINLPSNLDKPGNWKLRLRGAQAKAYKHAVILYPTKLQSCNTTTAIP